MKLLAIDAATEACSVALDIDGEITSIFEVAPQQHSQMLLPMVDDILSQADIKLAELDGIIYGQGPGSFTGVRIGVSITQGLAFAADLPVVGVSNLAAMAQQVLVQHDAKEVLVAIDAKMSEIYTARYVNVDGLAKLVGQEQVIAPTALPQFEAQGLFSAGTGWQTYQVELSQRCNAALSQVHLPSAEFMLFLGREKFDAGMSQSAEFAQPNYVRDEVSWKKLPGR